MTEPLKTATRIKDLETFFVDGREALYELSSPLDGWDYVIASCYKKTLIFASDAEGQMVSGPNRLLQVHDTLDHAAALLAAGYKIVEAG